MPTISVARNRLFEALGRSYIDETFEELCISYGLGLDDIADVDGEIIYNIEVPDDRNDLLCLEGLVQSLRIFIGIDQIPLYVVAKVTKNSMLKVHVKPETSAIRPYLVCAVLRDITFDKASYNSFIDLQDKLHQNICRQRTLVAIGTHDLDTIEGPFTYEALPPSDIQFQPLQQTETFKADKLMEFYKSDLKLNKYLHIIEGSDVFPVIYDRNRTVLSLPPIINGAHSAISLATKNVFIECTATDLTKAKIVLNTMVTMFSAYCKQKYEVEPVAVVNSDGESKVYPDLSHYLMEVPLSYFSRHVGVSFEAHEVVRLLNKMQIEAELIEDDTSNFIVFVPPNRSDVLVAYDVAENVAIAYGYENIPKWRPRLIPAFTELSVLDPFCDRIRTEMARYGFTEVLTWVLCAHKEIFSMLNREDDGKTALITAEIEVPRNSLMAGILKTVAYKDHRPVKIFEVGDVVLFDDSQDVGARSCRHLAVLYCDRTSETELIEELMDTLMDVMQIPYVLFGGDTSYHFECSNGAEFVQGEQDSIIYKEKHIGTVGIVHPEVLGNFGISDPCSFLELNIDSLL